MQDDRAVGIAHDEVKQVAHFDLVICLFELDDAVLGRRDMTLDPVQADAPGLGMPGGQRLEAGVNNDTVSRGTTADNGLYKEIGSSLYAPNSDKSHRRIWRRPPEFQSCP